MQVIFRAVDSQLSKNLPVIDENRKFTTFLTFPEYLLPVT